MSSQLAAVIFRRDLRLNDHTALLRAANSGAKILAIFCLNPEQISNNPYAGDAALQFMQDSLQDLDLQLKKIGGNLQIFKGTPLELVQELSKLGVNKIFANSDYTPYAIKRDQALKQRAEELGIELELSDDYLLHPPTQIHKPDGKPYTIYTPFYKKAASFPVALPISPKNLQFSDLVIPNIIATNELNLPSAYSDKLLKGGRTQALKILQGIAKYQDYKIQRDFPALDATTKLSAHLKFGTVSAREVFHIVAKAHSAEHTIIKELYWRDFFTQIAFHFPYIFGQAFNPKYRNLAWDDDRVKFQAWCDGQTGFPIVDAGMRELNHTGYMHNRVRMIVASFLIKDLHIDWQWGEQYFAQKLCDYDPAVNNGNWQWAASTGCDAAPYFRIFNPWLQQVKFDPDAIYIKRWIPELKDLSADQIHAWEETQIQVNYPAPILDHASEKIETLQRYAD